LSFGVQDGGFTFRHMKETITIWQAIKEMREATGRGETFSMAFMSYDRTRGKSQGVVQITKARLRPATHRDQNRNADFMLNFLDVETNLPRQMYQVTLMELNGKRVELT
jgi:hypothetical protein